MQDHPAIVKKEITKRIESKRNGRLTLYECVVGRSSMFSMLCRALRAWTNARRMRRRCQETNTPIPAKVKSAPHQREGCFSAMVAKLTPINPKYASGSCQMRAA